MIATVVMVVAVVGALTTLAVYAITATRRAGNQQARGDGLAVRLEARTADRDDLAQKLKEAKERGDALDDLLAETAAACVGPVDGALGRLLQAWGNARAGAGQGVVPADPTPDDAGPNDLLPFPRHDD